MGYRRSQGNGGLCGLSIPTYRKCSNTGLYSSQSLSLAGSRCWRDQINAGLIEAEAIIRTNVFLNV